MLYYLQDCSKSTPIGQLPGIINHNNEAIANLFNWIYDSSLNRLTKSVYAPTGTVTAHFGEFVNLSTEYITIKHVDSLKNSIQKVVDECIAFDTSIHNTFNGRFSSSTAETAYKDTSFCHDASAIAYADITVYAALLKHATMLLDISARLNDDISTAIEEINTSINTVNSIVASNKKKAEQLIADLSSNVSENMLELETSIAKDIIDLSTSVDESIVSLDASIKLVKEECTYIAGHNVEIEDNVVSATGYACDGSTFDILNGTVYIDSSDMYVNGGISADGNIITNDDIAFNVDGSLYTGSELVHEIKTLRTNLADLTEKYNSVALQLVAVNAAIEDIYARLDGVAVHANDMLSIQTHDDTSLNDIDYEQETLDEATELATKING